MSKAYTVLVVEDEPALLDILAAKLIQTGLTVITAENGQEGLNLALSHHPDLILLDIIMPVMDGMTMLRELRKDAWGKSAKVVLLTNLSEGEQVDESFEQGVYDYLVKSEWKLEDIINKVKGKLGITT